MIPDGDSLARAGRDHALDYGLVRVPLLPRAPDFWIPPSDLVEAAQGAVIGLQPGTILNTGGRLDIAVGGGDGPFTALDYTVRPGASVRICGNVIAHPGQQFGAGACP